MIRCRNWEHDPDTCGQSCGVPVPEFLLEHGLWIDYILDFAPEWFIMVRACRKHGRHLDPYCSVACFSTFNGRHAHADEAAHSHR